ncbi:ammonium transporter [Sporichthya brevicatena]|uniref:ammonium transporter n=1 Tax=Sporichthya brevicatena TaxID=171442 RepID=UPI0031E049D1
MFYALATVCLLFVVGAVGLIDAGLVRRKNLMDTWIQKLVASMLAAIGITIVGYAIWIWQYYSAFGVPDPLKTALDDWTPFGPALTEYSQNLDPAHYIEADVFQVFVAFFMAYVAVGGALLHSAGLERVKAVPMYVIAFVFGALVCPFVLYLTWGSVGPLSNKGAHDYIGQFALYIVVGVWALILAWRAGPRIGAFDKDPRTVGPVPHNVGWTAVGVAILMFAAPFAFLGCGFFVPDVGYFGISLSNSGFGIVVINVFAAYVGGVLAGALISYRTRNPIFVLIGIPAGYISTGTALDIGRPWEILVLAFIGMFVVYGTYQLLYKLKIDDKKIVPLALGGGSFGALAGGIVGSGDKTGGFFGITEGKYAFQHAEISIGMQALALVVTIAIAGISGLILIVGLEKTIGLRVSEEDELRGLDEAYWGTPPPPYVDEILLESDVAPTSGSHRAGRRAPETVS